MITASTTNVGQNVIAFAFAIGDKVRRVEWLGEEELARG